MEMLENGRKKDLGKQMIRRVKTWQSRDLSQENDCVLFSCKSSCMHTLRKSTSFLWTITNLKQAKDLRLGCDFLFKVPRES